MTIAVDWDVKNQTNNIMIIKFVQSVLPGREVSVKSNLILSQVGYLQNKLSTNDQEMPQL